MNDYLNSENDFPFLFDKTFHIMSHMKGVKVSNGWMTYAEGLGKKLLGHLTAVYSLYRGTNIILHNKAEIKFIDFSSICILSRAALETYLTFYFIFCDSKNQSEREFRYLVWDLAGYIERQGFLVELKESRRIKEKELNELNEVKKKIRSHQYFNSLSDSLKNRVLNGDWKMGNKIPDVAEKAGFSKEYIGTLYSYLCGHSHTSRASAMQVYQAEDFQMQKELAVSEVGIATILISCFLFDYSTLFFQIKNAFEKDKATYNCARAWRELGHNLKTSELEVIEYIANELQIDPHDLSKSTTFESLNLSNERIIELAKKFCKTHFITIDKDTMDNLKSINDLIEIVQVVRENTKLD